jgi:glucan endo-1,3-alpha-glucosidase
LQNQYSIDIFFVPSIFSDISTFKSNTWMDGELNWNSAWPMGNNQISTDTDNAYMNALGGKEYMSAVSPFFYTHFSPQTWNKNWLYRGDDWLYCSRWEQIIATRDKHSMTEILTWNDFGESSYISPIHGALPASSEAWVNGYDHQGLNVLTKYYATAFKTGSYPSIEKDTLVMWSRPHPHDANAPDGTGKPTGWDWTTDYVWAVVLSTGDATVTLTSGSNTQTFTVKAGLTKLKIANAVGGMSGQITRNGQTVAKYDGAGFTYTTTPSSYNYNYFVGSSS